MWSIATNTVDVRLRASSDVNHEIYGEASTLNKSSARVSRKPPRFALPGWTDYGGSWSVKDGVVSVKAEAG